MVDTASHLILDNFYKSRTWLDFRLYLIYQRTTPKGTYCEHCGNLIQDEAQVIAHHKRELTPENVRDTMISLNPDNILLVHHGCHNQIHNRYGVNRHSVYIVYGAPLSGKNTYVRNNMMHGDIVVDMDMLYRAVTLNDLYNKPNSLLMNVRAVHATLIDNIRTRYGKWNNAWVIGSYADRYKREQLAHELGAVLVFCDASRDDCIRRLSVDVDRQYRRDEWCKYINEWFDRYS